MSSQFLVNGFAQGLDFIGPLPGKVLVFPSEMAVDGGLAELRAPQIQIADDVTDGKRERLGYGLVDDLPVDVF